MTLLNQLLTVCILITGTVLVLYYIGDEENSIGSSLQLICSIATGKAFRAAAYIRLELTEDKEDLIIRWNLFPHKSNLHWWNEYMQVKAGEAHGFTDWERKLASPVQKCQQR